MSPIEAHGYTRHLSDINISSPCSTNKVFPNLKPPVDYSIDILWNISYTQTDYVIDAFKIPYSNLNPSMVVDPTNSSKVIMIWRIMDKGHHDKIGFHWLDRNSFKVIKKPDFVGEPMTQIISSSILMCIGHF